MESERRPDFTECYTDSHSRYAVIVPSSSSAYRIHRDCDRPNSSPAEVASDPLHRQSPREHHVRVADHRRRFMNTCARDPGEVSRLHERIAECASPIL